MDDDEGNESQGNGKRQYVDDTTENPLTFTYQEKDGVLELSFKDYSHQNEQVTVQLHKAVKGEVEDFKNRSKEDLIKSMTPENRHSFKE